jgi:hypothetical protein
MKKRTTIKRTTGKRNQHQSMLVTEKSRFLNEMPTSGELNDLNKGWDVDALVESLKSSALAFLIDRNIPIDDAPHGSAGVLPPDVVALYEHIAGVSSSFTLLFELYCFSLARNDNSERAYSHLLRAAQCIELISVAKLEAGYLAGAARVGGSEKTDKKLERQKILLKHYGDLRSEGKPKQEARRLACARSKIPMSTVKKWFSLEQIEKAYHQFT